MSSSQSGSEVRHVCSSADTCMCFYDPDLNPSLVSMRLVPTDDDARQRAMIALCRFLFPGYHVPRTEMIDAVIDALAGDEGWEARLPARKAAAGGPRA